MKTFINILLVAFVMLGFLALVGFFIFSVIYAIKIQEYGGAFLFGVLAFGLIIAGLVIAKEYLEGN